MRPELHGVTINPFAGNGEITVLFAGNNRTPPLHQVGPHVLGYHLVHLVVSGKGSLTSRGARRELKAGDCFFIYPGELAGYVSDETEPWSYRWIGFRGTEVDYRLRELGVEPDSPVLEGGGTRRANVLFWRVQDALRTGGPGCDLKAGANLRLVFGEWADRKTDQWEGDGSRGRLVEAETSRRMEHAARYLALQYHRPVSMDELAKETGYHRAYLSRMFKKTTGQSPAQYLLKLRMERARQLLGEPLTIGQIAASVGFADPFHFSRQFKKWHGCSPSELRVQKLGMEHFQPES